MNIDYEKWHDGIGYAVDLLHEASDTERAAIVALLVPPQGWRDVEALAALNSDAAMAALRIAFHGDDAEVRVAVTRFAPALFSDDERAALLVRALEGGEFYQDMSSALDQVEAYHPPPVVDALFRGLFVRPGDVACHFAAMLTFVHGKAESTFDWDKRPLFLRFNTDDQVERLAAFHELCALLEVDAAQKLATIRISSGGPGTGQTRSTASESAAPE